MKIQFTVVFQKVPEGFIGFVDELPGANTQEANRLIAEETIRRKDVIREPLLLSA